MTIAGWVIMFVGVSGMTGLLGWCIYKIIATKDASGHLHAPLDIDTKD